MDDDDGNGWADAPERDGNVVTWRGRREPGSAGGTGAERPSGI